jgi:hypothetical protein
MKLVSIMLIVGVSAAAVVAGYTYFKPETNITTIAIDKTDSAVAQVLGQRVIANKAFTGSIWNGHIVRIICITGYDVNPVKTITLLAANAAGSNSHQRREEVERFTLDVQLAIDSIAGVNMQQTHSVIYKPLVKELHYLATYPADHKRLWVFSDLKENNSLYSIYPSTVRRVMHTNSDSVKAIFLTAQTPDDIHGITIGLIHQVNSTRENETYFKMATIFQAIFKDAGADVSITATLDN